MVEYLAGNRIIGTTEEDPMFIGGWKEVARTTLGSDTSTLDVSNLPNKKYYMILSYYNLTGNGNPYLRLNGDTGTKYDLRHNMDGSESTGVSNTDRGFYGAVSGTNSLPYFEVNYFANETNKVKLGIGFTTHQNTAGASDPAHKTERAMKYVNTSDPITSVNYWNQNGVGSFASGSECVVLGYDPDDVHGGDNFWQPLASVELDSTASEIDTGEFTPKKYLMVQGFAHAVGATDIVLEFNGSNSGYTRRNNANGTEASGVASQSHADIGYGIGSNSHNKFFNSFIFNKSDKEKLVTSIAMHSGGTGSGQTTARNNSATKWTDTTEQINRIKFQAIDSTGFGSGTTLKVWGHD